MDIIRDLLYTNLFVLKRTFYLFKRNWIIIFTGLIYTLISIFSYYIIVTLSIGFLSIIGGILQFLISSALISNYLYILYKVIEYEKVTLQDFKEGFKPFFRKVITIVIIGSLSSYLFSLILEPILAGILGPVTLSIVINLLVFVLLNALPESIYQKFYEPWETIVYSFNFIKDNWLEWFIPNLIFIGSIFLITRVLINNIFITQFNFTFDLSLKSIIIYIVGQVILSFYMIYRGVLFNELSTSTRRKRLFKRKML